MQTFLTSPKFEKKYLYKNPTLLYHEFCNAWAYQKMIELSNPNPQKQQLLEEANTIWKEVKKNNVNEIKDTITRYLATPVPLTRYEHDEEIQIPRNAVAQRYANGEKERAQKKVAEYTTILDISTDNSMKKQLVNQINSEKQWLLLEENIVEKYDSPGRPSHALKNPELYDQLHACIEFGSADNRRRKEWIKVRTISHLRTAMEENYQQYLSKSCLQTYLLPRHPNSNQAKRHHHPALIRNVAVSRNEMSSHEDSHYCLASVKGVRQFAETFPEHSIIISQDDKAKVPLGFQESFLDSSNMHRPIVVLLVDGGPDENPRHLKNIKQYCKYFRDADLDYMTIRTHAPGQSAYNPVERSMASLSRKLAGITLPHDKYGSHLRNGKEAATLLAQNDGFLPPVSKGRDNHFLNPIHILEYFDVLKIPKYDQHCPSISSELHQRLCCNLCDKYFPTLSFVTEHKKTVHTQYCKRSNRIQNLCTYEDIPNNLPFVVIDVNFRNVLSDHE
ncbi:hypothetical protein GLOIN_2v1766467 [Rhizophagus clarus]|uniref:C2H2-type domain-containing protein n=1 Tax=Rhizophagus clarus TaxID=94130 RepID=A0A8H3LK05_9GLOM|nr:hypothetical protein GLOIN_2v1766467 [Rhizophagus clarus]